MTLAEGRSHSGSSQTRSGAPKACPVSTKRNHTTLKGSVFELVPQTLEGLPAPLGVQGQFLFGIVLCQAFLR